MPADRHQLIMGGMEDCVLSIFKLTKHAQKRCRERNISLEELQKRNPRVTIVKHKNTIITVYHKETKNHFIEIVNHSPKILKNSLGQYIAEIYCDNIVIPILYGRQRRNMIAMQDLLDCQLFYLNETKTLQITTLSRDRSFFSYNFLNTIVKKIVKMGKDVYSFRIGRIDISGIGQDIQKDLNEKYGKIIYFFYYQNFLYFFTIFHLQFVRDFIDFLKISHNKVIFFSTQTHEVLKDEDEIIHYILPKNSQDENMKKVLCPESVIHFFLKKRMSKMYEIKNFIGCDIEYIESENVFKISSDTLDINHCEALFMDMIYYSNPENNKKKLTGLLKYGKITVSGQIKTEKVVKKKITIYYQENEVIFISYSIKSIKKLLMEYSLTINNVKIY